MTLKADIVTDLTNFFNTDEFADSATYTHAAVPATIKVIFDDDYQAVQGVESSGPVALAKTTDVSAAIHGDTLVINTVTWYVRGIQPNGDTTLLILSRE